METGQQLLLEGVTITGERFEGSIPLRGFAVNVGFPLLGIPYREFLTKIRPAPSRPLMSTTHREGELNKILRF
jgi:hypothetical protein